ncbi:acetyltransferase [Frondihabitans sp. 4ASC-45]|uniref:acetyltransferase n=1 Tax=Frondihabitans sp. 4ASC-45 TaxID=3111636 RepID=UPI003C19792C
MDEHTSETASIDDLRVISLAKAPGEQAAWDRPRWVVYAWSIAELLFVTNPWQISSRLRVAVLRAFGADIEDGVIFRPRTRIRFPWKLHIGRDSWIGEGVWFHNQDHIYVGHDVVISQETFLTTGSHAHRLDMALITRPIHIEPGVWITSRCVILGGAHIGRSALVKPMTVVGTEVKPNTIVQGSPWAVVGRRFEAK